MRIIRLSSTDPTLNLACEEMLLSRAWDDLFMLWRNDKSVIVGRNQNTLSEIDPAFVAAHGIPVVRRLTGGGAVFHDLGNLNYTCISAFDGPLDFARFAQPMVEALGALGLSAALTGRNDISIDGKKVSGNAQTVRHGRVLHHGTLLYSADLSTLSGALRVKNDKYDGKGVASVASRVGNIASFLADPMPVEDFFDYLYHFALEYYPGASPYLLSEADLAEAERLRADKYATDAWNYGQMADYNFSGTCRRPSGGLEVFLTVEAGVIRAAKLSGDFFGRREVSELESSLVGQRHNRAGLAALLETLPLSDYLWGFAAEDVLAALF